MLAVAALAQKLLRRTSECVAVSNVTAAGVLSRPRNNRPESFISSSPLWVVLPIAAEPSAHSGTRRGRGRPQKENRTPSVAVQAHLATYNIDVVKVVKAYPPIASYDEERVQKVTAYLARMGVDVKRVVDKYPMILSGQVEAYEKVVQLLRDNGVDVVRAVDLNPNVLQRRIATLQCAMDAVVSCGHTVADIFTRYPGFMRMSAADVSIMLELQGQTNAAATRPHRPMHPKALLFYSLGLDSEWLLKKMPRALALSMDKLQSVLQYLNSLGVDVSKVVRSNPTVLGFRTEALQQRVQFLKENGFNVVQSVNGCPSLLYLNVERKLRPILDFVVQDMGLAPSELNKAGRTWTYDLEGRLRPRFFYLKSLGRSAGSLSTFAICSDVRFATRIAKTDLQEYYAWRRRNGHSVTQCGPSPAQRQGPTVDESV
eukprot:EG_transcript_11471